MVRVRKRGRRRKNLTVARDIVTTSLTLLARPPAALQDHHRQPTETTQRPHVQKNCYRNTGMRNQRLRRK